jgi:hypothetical protein
MHLLNKIQNWTQSGPAGNSLMQDPEYDFDALISATQVGEAGGILEAAGFSTAPEDWSEDYALYITPYDPTAESAVNLNFLDTMTQKFSEAYAGVQQATTGIGRSGFGTAYGQVGAAKDVIANLGASMSSARHQKDANIRGRREDWISDLWDDFAMLASLGALDDEGD